MNRLNIVISLTIIIISLISSCVTEKSSLIDTRQNASGAVKPGITLGKILLIDTFDLNIVPPSSGVQYYKDGIVFLSGSKIESNMLPKHLSFGNTKAYYAMLYDAIPVNYTVFSPLMPFSYPCEAITFSKDYNTMYFTRISETDGKEKIYKAVYSSNTQMQPGWTADTDPVNFCTEQSAYSHPALSPDGKQMVFSSDKTVSGGMDLFISRKEGERWTEPENLGKEINSGNNELFPFLNNDNDLFFSSDRQSGSGGYDIYMCKNNGKGWNKPEHLTSLINSPEDEMAFTIDRKDGKSAFFTVKGKAGKGRPQLYRLTINNNLADRTKDLSAILYGMTTPSGEMTAMAKEPLTEIKSKTTEKTETKTEDAVKEITAKSDKTATEVKKETTPPAGVTATGEKKEATVAQTKPIETKTEIKEEPKTETTVTKDVVIYRVQIITTDKSKASYTLKIGSKSYNTYEYYYKSAYRITVGEFSTLASAVKFQSECRQNGYPQAFVVAFKNNVRSTDPQLFK